MTLTPEKKKQLFAGGLFFVLAIVVYYQFFSSSDAPTLATPRSTPRVTDGTAPANSQPPVPVRVSQNPRPVITDPLPLTLLGGRGTPDGAERNIFVYPTPTPVPTPKPPPPTPTPVPPPIMITSLNPAGKIARTADFEISILGAKIPRDAKVFINGRDYPTTVLNESQLTAKIAAVAISQSGNLRVEVKSAGDASLFSNPLNLHVADPPVPPYVYVALIIDKNGVHTAIVKSQADGRLVNVRIGDALGKWRILGINGQRLEVLDTEYDIKHQVAFTGETG